LHRLVPEGASIYTGTGKHADSIFMAEVAIPWAQPTATKATAGWESTIVTNPSVCDGLQLRVKKLR
jgi:hypothetical protein